MSTLILNKSAVMRSVQAVPLLEELRSAFQMQAPAPTETLPHKRLHDFGQLDVRCPGILPTLPAYTLSVSSLFGEREKTQVALYDLKNGALLALLEARTLLQLAHSLVNALAVEVLTPPSATNLAVVGADDESRRHVKALRLVRSLSSVKVFDADPARAHHWAAEIFGSLSLPAHAFPSLDEALENQDMLFVSSGANLSSARLDLPQKMHVTLSSLASPAARLLPPSIRWVTDEAGWAQRKGLPDTALLSELLAKAPAPSGPSVFVSSLPPAMDLVAAWHVYQSAQALEEGLRVEFLE